MQAEYSDEISGDMQERQRILLEQEIMRDIAEGSILDSVSNHSHEYSVEHPRRDPHSPGAFDEFRSFAAHSADVSRHEEYAPFPDHRLVEMSYSFRPNDDSAAVGETMSTAQHHASAVTLGAGLGGFRRSPGRSGLGGEFDPDREVNALLDGRGDISYFDDTQQSARRQTGPPSANNRRPTRPSPAKSTGVGPLVFSPYHNVFVNT